MNLIKVNHPIEQPNLDRKMHRKVRKCKHRLMSLSNLISILIIVLSTGWCISVCRATDHQATDHHNSYYFEVIENTIENRLVGQVNLIGTPNSVYRFGKTVPEFRLDSANGRIYTTKHALDRERQQFYNLIILSNQPTSVNPIQVKIKVIDENDNKPFWLNEDVNRQISFSETAPIGSKVILDTAIDLDEDLLRYELVHCIDLEQCSCVNSADTVNSDIVNNDTVNSDKSTVHRPIKPFKLNFNDKNSILNLELNERLDRELISSYTCKLCVFDLKNQSNSVYLNIKVLDVNDCAPAFDRSNYSTTLNHNLKKDDLIIQTQAVDLDEPGTLNSKLIYSLHNENNLINSNYDNVEDFYINKTTGSIHMAHDGLPTQCVFKLDNNQMSNQLNSQLNQLLNSQVNNGLKSACVFTVVCEDQGNPKQQSKAYVTVYLSSTDNQHVPEIKILYFNHRFVQYAIVDQDAAPGTAVAAISVFADNGQSGQTSLEIVSGNELEHFYLDSEFSSSGSYVIRVNHNFTILTKRPNIYNMTIKATDYGQVPLSSTQNLVIKINELTDDHKPEFNQAIYRVELEESAPIGSFICLVNAIDYDHQQSIVYFYSLSGNNSDYLHIDSQTGMVTLAKQLDRELINDLELKVYVRDTHLNSEWSSAKIFIQVLDANDNQPRVIRTANLKHNYEIVEKDDLSILKIAEGSRVNYEFTVVDDDFGQNGSVIVELLYDYQGLFYLNTTSYMNRKEKIVHLHSTKELDYELEKNYELILILSDQGKPKQSSQFRIQIDVQDQDDQPAIVYPKHYFINVNDQNRIRIRTVDADKQSPVRFFFNFNNNHKNLNFVNSLAEIDEQSGSLLFKSINLSAFPKYLPFNVTCDRCDRLNQQATVHLYLNNMNDEQTTERQTIVLSELSEPRTILNLKENLFRNLNDSFRLLISDGDSEQSFTIVDHRLVLVKPLDYRKRTEYNLTVCAYTAEQFKLGNLIIKIKNENNQHPEFRRPYVYLELPRDCPYHMSIFKLNATDSDDRDEMSSSNIVYHFTAAGQSNSTLIRNGNYMFRINENELELNVNLFERKFGSNDELDYLYRQEFVYLVSVQARDLNLKNDLQSNRRTINIFIKIKEPVIEANELFDKSLELVKSFYELNIEESKQINSRLLKFDLFYHRQLDGRLTFEFINDEHNLIKNQFGLFPDGTLYLKTKLDREQNSNFIVQVAVSLNNSKRHDKVITVLVHVLDNNDNIPTCEQEIYQFQVIENSPANTSIGSVKATDKDLNSNSLINYSLLTSKFSNLIGLNSLTGQLYMKSPVDYESIKVISFEVEAEDQAIFERRLKSKCKVHVHVVDVNDCAPCFELYDSESGNYLCANKLKQQISIMENLKPNSTIHEFMAKDQDTSKERLRFTLIESEFSSSFHLDSVTGRLKIVKNLDREINEKIELLIKVDDGLHEAFNNFVVKLDDVNDNVPIWRFSHLNPNETTIHVPENTEPGTSLFELKAVDYDSGLNGQIHFEILSVDSVKADQSELCNLPTVHPRFCEQGDCFRIENNQLVLTNYLDYENEREYEINLTAVDYYGLRSEILSLKLKVLDLNDCRPTFKRISADEETIFESIKMRSVIVQLTAYDCDEKDELRYELIKCEIIGTYPKQCPLDLDSRTGKLTSTDNLDYKEIKRINLKIKVTDLGEHTDLKAITIDFNRFIVKITEEKNSIASDPEANEHVPTFESSHYSFNVSESTKNKTIIGKIEAKDLDVNSHLKYKIISEQDDSPFKLNERTGNIHLIRPVDYDTDNHIYISICQATDGEFLSSPVTLYFNIQNENDNSPVFQQTEYRFVFNENQSVNSELFCLRAKDDDDDKLTYRMHENDEKEYQLFNYLLEEFYFEVNSDGCVKLLKRFNVEEKDHFQFEMSVTDGQHHDFATVQLQIIRNETSKPIKNFRRKNLAIKLNANSSIGDTIYTFNENVQLLDDHRVPFRINSFNELVLTRMDTSKLIYNFQLNYSHSIQNVTVSLQSDQFEPIRFERSQYELQVYEDCKLSRPIIELSILNLRKNDKLNLEIIAGNQDDQFLLSRNLLLLTRPLNYEKVKKYSLKVKLTNLDREVEAYASIQVNVLNVVDKRPVFLDTPYHFKWLENTVGELGRFIARSEYDLQSTSNNLRYLLKNNEFDYFSLDTNTGQLNVIKEIDRESLRSPIIELNVLVIDELNANLQNEAVVTIEIVGLNDNQPKWSQSNYEIGLTEQVRYAKGYSVKNLTAYDADNDRLTYRIVRSDSKLLSNKFSLNESTGELYLDEEVTFDREQDDEYGFVVETSDGEFRSNCTVTIKIKDLNDQRPKLSVNQSLSDLVRKQLIKEDQLKVIIPYQYFTSDSYMTENEQLFLIGLNAIDLDAPNTVNSKINFKLIQTDTRKFKLNKDNGVLAIQNSLVGALNTAQNRSFKIDIQLQDCNANSLESRIQIDLELYDLNTLKWMTIFEPITAEPLQVSEGTAVESVIYKFKLLKHLTNSIHLQIVGGDYDNRFKIVQENNAKFNLVLDKQLDYEYVPNYLIYLEATTADSSNRTNFQILELNIKLINENDHAPRFSNAVYNVTILEEQEPNLFVIQLDAFDLDSQAELSVRQPEAIEEDDFNSESVNVNADKQSEFRFEILNTNVPFRIDQYSGAVYTTGRIDREETGDLFELTVQVEDNGGLKSQAKLNVHIQNINDHPPRFSSLFRVNVTESEKIGAFIIQINFTDRDQSYGANSTHKFSISDNRFTIDPYTGKVYLASKLDCDFGEDELQVVVTVNDGQWEQNTILTVFIKDENDQVPVFEDCRKHFMTNTMDKDENCIYHFELDEHQRSIGRILAKDSDKDKELNALVTYRFTEESDLFKIDQSTGELFKLDNYLNLQHKPSLHRLKVQACDNGLLPQCSLAKIYLTRNQNLTTISLPIPLDLSNGTVIYKAKETGSRIESEGFGFCNGTSSLAYRNQSLMFIGRSRVRLGDQFVCQFWSVFELEKFTNLRIVITKRNLFEPQFLTFVTNQLVLNETANESESKRKQVVYQFKATDNDSSDGFNNEITFKLALISVQYNSAAQQYYFKRFKNGQEDECFFARSIEHLLLNNNSTKHYLNPFVLDSKSGHLYLEHQLDYELITSYKLQITIVDHALFDQKNSSQTVDVIVHNLDDNKPLFVVNGNELTNELNLFVPENRASYEFDKLAIIDFDDPSCCLMNDFPILRSPDSSHFQLDQGGHLKALTSFDYESKSNYEIALPQDLKINVHVVDVCERKPKFTKRLYEFSLLEQTKLNTVIANLNHTIEEGHNHQSANYELQLLKPISFGIELRENNDLIVSDQVDFESFSMNEIYRQTQQDNVSISQIKLKFTLLVKLKDDLVANATDYDRAELLINLVDLNEPPIFESQKSTIDCLLVRTNGQCAYQFVNECRATAFDYDQNDYVRYRLLNHNHLFTIDEQGRISLSTCNLTTNLPPDNNQLDVIAFDSSELQARIKINIKLNWRSRVVESAFGDNQLSYNNNTLLESKDLTISKWCTKGRQVPESTDRMICYRKTADRYCCECKSHYQGMHCAYDDLCATANNCENGGLCKQINAREHICLCRKEFRGARCEQALNHLCTSEKAGKCGVNGVCEIVKPFGHRCNCLDQHTFGASCNAFSLGLRPFAYIRLNVSLNEVNDELSMTFASFYRTNQRNAANEEFGQLLFYNHGQPNMQTGRTDFITLELYERYVLLRVGGSHQSKFVELKVYANKHDLVDGRYYKFSLIRNRKIAHISIYSCIYERIYLHNQLNCNNLLNQSSISFNQPSFHFNSNPAFIGGLDYLYGGNQLFAQKTNGHVQARSNFVGCLYKATLNGVKINEYIAEKSFVAPICRPTLIYQPLLTSSGNQAAKSTNDSQETVLSLRKQTDCSYCGNQSVYCKQNWFEDKCGCTVQVNNQTNIVYESSKSCNSLCEIQLNRKSLIKLRLGEKWNTIMKSQTYQTRLEEFVLRFYPTAHSPNDRGNLWTNGYLSIRVSSNGTIHMINEEDQFEQVIKLNGGLRLNQWNTLIVKATGELHINDHHNRFNPQLFQSNLKSMIVGGDLVGCLSHIIINGHLVLNNNNEHLYELHTENVNGFGCKNVFEFSRLSLDAISIGIILIIMFFVILLLVISTSFMLFNNSSKRKTSQAASRSTLPTISKHHFHPMNKTTLTPHHSLTQMLGNNSYSSQDYEEPFYYGSDYFQHNEKLASSNQFNLSNRSQF